MREMQLKLTGEEQEFLAEYLGTALKHLQVEEHRTRALAFREHVTHEKDVLAGILAKLGGSSVRRSEPIEAAT